MSVQLWKDGQFQSDTWRHIQDGEDVPPAGAVIMSLAWWQSQKPVFEESNVAVGVQLEPLDDLDAIAEDVGRLALIALNFPSFANGTAFSIAARLRGRYGFTGTLRAVGDVLIDQIQFMERCGFDEFEIADDTTAKALSDKNVPNQQLFYQPASAAQEEDSSDSANQASTSYVWRRNAL